MAATPLSRRKHLTGLNHFITHMEKFGLRRDQNLVEEETFLDENARGPAPSDSCRCRTPCFDSIIGVWFSRSVGVRVHVSPLQWEPQRVTRFPALPKVRDACVLLRMSAGVLIPDKFASDNALNVLDSWQNDIASILTMLTRRT